MLQSKKRTIDETTTEYDHLMVECERLQERLMSRDQVIEALEIKFQQLKKEFKEAKLSEVSTAKEVAAEREKLSAQLSSKIKMFEETTASHDQFKVKYEKMQELLIFKDQMIEESKSKVQQLIVEIESSQLEVSTLETKVDKFV